MFIPIFIVEHYSAQKRRRQSSEAQETEHERTDDEDNIDISTEWGFLLLLGMHLVRIDEEGLATWTFNTGSVTVPWSEARLFCIVGGGRSSKSQIVYMLASEQACARWVDVPSRSFRTLSLNRPMLPDVEHQQKMQALLQVIAGKAGLPLYDLREST